jgi:hypothetical protein
MYLWKVDKLVEDFKSGKVSQKEEFKYMLLFTVLMIFASDPFLYVGSSYNIYDFVGTMLMLTISVWGIYYCYKINSAGDNKNFIVRVMCISLPVIIRILVIFIPIVILVGVLEGLFSGELTTDESNTEVYETTSYQVVTMVAFVVSYYVYLSKKIRLVSS